MKVYVIVTDDHMTSWGAEFYCHGIYTDYYKALEAKERMKLMVPDDECIFPIEVNKDCSVRLGGYIE